MHLSLEHQIQNPKNVFIQLHTTSKSLMFIRWYICIIKRVLKFRISRCRYKVASKCTFPTTDTFQTLKIFTFNNQQRHFCSDFFQRIDSKLFDRQVRKWQRCWTEREDTVLSMAAHFSRQTICSYQTQWTGQRKVT